MHAMLWESLRNNQVQCQLCAHKCLLKNGDKGRCGVRLNKNGTLLSLVTNVATSLQLDPVEKKPLYHFLPGSKIFSIGSAGCNFSCKFCQNYAISQIQQHGRIPGKVIEPDELVNLAESKSVRSIAFTYNEPTVFFELMYKTTGLAQTSDIRSVIVSNGHMSQECLQTLARRLHAANIDLKSFRETFYKEYCNGHLQPVLDNLKTLKSLGVWLEVTTLVIPGLNDGDAELRDIAAFIHDELGRETPWHLSAFHGDYQMTDHPATPVARLEDAWRIGRETGLDFVYIGNVRTLLGGDTFCPQCGEVAIERKGYAVSIRGKAGVCPSCKADLPGIWQ
ncbi:MAG: AmmeMemoRadiSam system radical SAM enzyme [Desulfovibrio sp.]|jgi:pyruvate formate lyase activating enzyme|nr:AmmeMemoRadiSam system radical SAM enzyme [Desulfovibrio sp.]